MDQLISNQEFDILRNVSIADYSYTHLGGIVEYLAFPKDRNQLIEIIEIAKKSNLKITILGKMSNLIIKDSGISGLVIILDNFKQIIRDENSIIAQSGATIIDVTNLALDNNLTGIEWAAGIPGSVGGAIFMNAGAYGGDIKQVVTKATVLDLDSLDFLELNHQQLQFGYRESIVQHKNYLIIDATFNLQEDQHFKIQELMDDYNYRRIDKQPLEYPSNGSVFKRPEGYYAGKLIMDAGLQGTKSGDAMISLKHANFIVNLGQATAADYLDLIALVQATIYKKNGIQIETEVELLGDD